MPQFQTLLLILGSLDLFSVPSVWSTSLVTMCPADCECDAGSGLVNCADLGLPRVPAELIPNGTWSLILDGNLITEIGDGALSRLGPWLRRLSLANNILESVSYSSFSGLGKLRYLDLSANRITDVPSVAIQGLSSLRKLVLSRNNLSFLPANTFRELFKLQELFLGENNIDSVQEGAFWNLASLKRLSLEDNLLDIDPVGWFMDTPLEELQLSQNLIPLTSSIREWFGRNGSLNLRFLFLARNGIKVLPRDVFRGLESLEVLDLTGNRLTIITKYDFEGLRGLRELKLDDNVIAVIHEESLHSLPDLNVLTVDGNQLKSLPRWLFDSIGSLVTLSAAFNSLENISGINENDGLDYLSELILTSNQIADISGTGFKSLPALTSLKLGDNHLQRVPNIHNLTSLQIIELNHNKIAKIHWSVFRRNSELQEIYLDNNRLEALDYELFADLQSLEILTLYGNPWWCDCRLVWMQDLMWSEEQPPWATTLAEDIICTSPQQLLGESLEYASLEVLHEQCPNFQLGVFLPVAISAWFVILGFLIARFWARKYFKLRKFSRQNRSNLDYKKRWYRSRKCGIIEQPPELSHLPAKKVKLDRREISFPLQKRGNFYLEIDSSRGPTKLTLGNGKERTETSV